MVYAQVVALFTLFAHVEIRAGWKQKRFFCFVERNFVYCGMFGGATEVELA